MFLLSSPLIYFTDPILRGPTIGCMLMCFAAALVGVIVFLEKKSLLGESLSHAAYPGVILGVIIAGVAHITDGQDFHLALLIMGGAFLTAIAGLMFITFLQRRLKVRSDSALCFVLSVFFGIGLTLASQVQFAYTSLYRQVQVYLYGQAATMTDQHILIYGVLSIVVLLVIVCFYKEIHVIAFDREYARSLGINTKAIDVIVFFLIILAVIIGIRSVGVVLMSAMLIAPAAAARQYTNKLYMMFFLAACFGLFSGFAGNFLSLEMTERVVAQFPNARFSLPTGPMIVIVASIICLFSLMFAPERGLVIRLIRIGRFRYQRMCENILKAIWRLGDDHAISLDEIAKHQSASKMYLRYILGRLTFQGWLTASAKGYKLTPEGAQWAARIVRLHRLWELYLVDYLGVGAERVHRSAEEMEHILTPEIESALTLLLNDPKYDPHHQPIPSKEL
jgi:manganese/zinc/iron transport system permease protein